MQERISIFNAEKRVIDDSSPGVPPEALPHIFDRLYRVDKSRSRSQGGSGLGLAITKGVVELFGGTIQAGAAGLGAED